MPVILLAKALKQKMLTMEWWSMSLMRFSRGLTSETLLYLMCSTRPGMMGSGTRTGVPMRGAFGVVLQMPFRGHFMWSFDVAGLGRRYLAMAFLERCVAPRRKPCWMAASNELLGGLQRPWCINLTLFSFVVWW